MLGMAFTKGGIVGTKLYFLRHGVAYEREEWQSDNDELRPLTDKGISAMKLEAKYLKQIGFKLDCLITSPLVRARDTAKFIAETFDLPVSESELLKPGFNVEGLSKLLNQYGTV